MARDKRVVAEAVAAEKPAHNSLIASAATIGEGYKNLSRLKRGAAWQTAAWNFYHTIGEFRYACDWVGAMLSKAVLFATVDVDGRPERTDNAKLAEFLDALYGDADGRAEMLRLMGIHLSVTGEVYLVGYPDPESPYGGDKWQLVTPTKISFPSDMKTGKYRINDEEIPLPAKDVLVRRIWRADPESPLDAISPARPLLAVLGEISRLTDHVAAQVDSRLAGAGILLVPSEMTFPAPPDVEGQPARTVNDAEELMAVLQHAMAKSIDDRSNASALVPIVIKAPADAIAAVKHLTFWSGLDEKAIELRTEAIRRLALGMDMPPEVLTGNADTNHWNAWQADEAAIKSHTEPLLKIITSALADGFLRPLVISEGKGFGIEPSKVSVGADTSELRLRPNRSKEALELHERGILSDEALLRETGFDANDAMDDAGRVTWFLRKVASGSTTPDLVAGALKALGVDIAPQATGEGETQEARPDPSLLDHPTQDIPDRERSERRKEARDNGDVLVASAYQIVLRALERAGNRIKNRLGGRVNGLTASAQYRSFNCGPGDLDSLLHDAWGEGIDATAELCNVDAQWLTSVLDNYTRGLLISKAALSMSDLGTVLELAKEKEPVHA